MNNEYNQKENISHSSSKKNKKKIYFIFIILLIILIGLIVCFLFMNGKTNNKSDVNTSEKNRSSSIFDDKDDKTPRKLNKDEIKYLINIINTYDLVSLNNGNAILEFNNEVTSEMMKSLFYYVKNSDNSFNEHFTNNAKWSFDKSLADDYFNNVFGFIPESYSNYICELDNDVVLYYDKDNEAFVYNDAHQSHNYPSSSIEDYLVTDTLKNADSYTLDVLFLTGDTRNGFYINGTLFTINSSETDSPTYEDYLEEFSKVPSNASKYKKYSYTFKRVDKTFILKSVETKN